MKKLPFLLTLVCLVNFAFAQDSSTREPLNLIIKTSLLYPVANLIFDRPSYLSLGAEKQIAQGQSLELMTEYAYLNNDFDLKQQAVFTLEYKYYILRGNAMEGFYMGGYSRYHYNRQINYHSFLDVTLETRDEGVNHSLGVGGAPGFQWLFFKNKIAVDAQAQFGLRYHLSYYPRFFEWMMINELSGQNIRPDYWFELNVGWRF